MRKLFFFIILFIGVLTNIAQAAITPTQVGMLDFKIDQSLTDDDMNGTNDVTVKLQTAVNNARNAYKSLYIPSGTYKISQTINCIYDESVSPKKATNIIGSSINHPVIKIADNTPFFNGTIPKAVFEYDSNNASHGTDWVMEGGIRAIDFDLGANNFNAVALYWGCAQYCYVEDININARSGFAGLTAIGGANCLFANITVDGGQYGLYLPNYNQAVSWGKNISAQNTISACTFTNQTNTPLVLWGYGGITLVGINIITSKSTAIKMNCEKSIYVFPLSMIDSKIEFTTPGSTNVAISNSNRGTISLRGVYVKGAGIISGNNNDENLNSVGQLSDWTCVNRYNYIEKVVKPDNSSRTYQGIHYNALTGSQYNTAVVSTSVSTPPLNLISNHIWPDSPSFEDEDAVLVTTVAALESAINANTKKICLAKGTYTLSKPLSLKANTILVGCPGYGSCGSIFKYGWTPTTQEWLINTVDDASATTYLMDITTDPGNLDYLGSLHWRAGANSIIRNVRFDKSWDEKERNMIRFYFSGNGGGRVFNYQDEKNLGTANILTGNSTNHRKVKISGTTQKLTFYGLCLERGGTYSGLQSAFPLVEMVNSSNISVYGAKVETYQPYAKISNCNNVFLTNIIDLCNINGGSTAVNFIEIDGASNNIEIANAMFLKPPSSTWMIVKDPWNTNGPNRNMNLGLYHRNFFDPQTSINEVTVSKKKWDIYPNPSKSIINIKSNLIDISESTANVFNLIGESVKLVELNSIETTIDLSNLSNGVYFVVIQDNRDRKEVFKVIKA